MTYYTCSGHVTGFISTRSCILRSRLNGFHNAVTCLQSPAQNTVGRIVCWKSYIALGNWIRRSYRDPRRFACVRVKVFFIFSSRCENIFKFDRLQLDTEKGKDAPKRKANVRKQTSIFSLTTGGLEYYGIRIYCTKDLDIYKFCMENNFCFIS